jgi:hypothetical protein
VMGTWPGKPKILYPRGSKKSSVVFNHVLAAMHARQGIVVTEGVFDALTVGPCAVALLGKIASRAQLGILAHLGQHRRLTIMLDPDAIADARLLGRRLARVCPDVRVAHLMGAKDPGEATRAQIVEALVRARRCGVGSTLDDAVADL